MGDGGGYAGRGIHGSPASVLVQGDSQRVSAGQKVMPEVQCLPSMLPSSRRRGKDTRTNALQDLIADSRSGSTSENLVARSKFSLTISKNRGSSSGSSTGPAMSETTVLRRPHSKNEYSNDPTLKTGGKLQCHYVPTLGNRSVCVVIPCAENARAPTGARAARVAALTTRDSILNCETRKRSQQKYTRARLMH